MTVEELLKNLDGLPADSEISTFLDGVQGEGVTKPRPILGVARLAGAALLIIGKRGETSG